jgi:hypothetical protein
MPAALDILNSIDDFQEVITYGPTAILRPDGTLYNEASVEFLLRVLISEIHGLRVDLMTFGSQETSDT